MFVIKQYNKQDLGYTAWSCKSYSVERGPDRTCIHMSLLVPECELNQALEINGPTYIENAVGKTIDRFEVQQPEPPQAKRFPRGIKF